jgi:large subunit ribosomal protein L21
LQIVSQKESPIKKINDELKANKIGRMFAVVHLCGKQFKVTDGDIIVVEGYWAPTTGDEIRLDKVKMLLQ